MATRPRHRLGAFGLTVASEIDLPALHERGPPGPADVVVTRGRVERPATPDDRTVHRAGPDELRLLYEAAAVSIRGGREITVDPEPGVSEEIVRHLVVGPAFNFLLHQRGWFVLHASTVAIGDEAVAFLGESGMGKTTTATAFLCAGHRVLSDDVAAVDLDGGAEPRVRSGYPSIKLDPALVDRFDAPVTAPERPTAARDRHFHGLCHDQPAAPVPLERIYRLEDGDSERIVPLESGAAVHELVSNTYTVPLLDDGDTAASNFAEASRIAASVPVRRLQRPRDLDRLPELVDLVEEDLDAAGR